MCNFSDFSVKWEIKLKFHYEKLENNFINHILFIQITILYVEREKNAYLRQSATVKKKYKSS